MTEKTEDLIAEARRWANGHPNRRSGELMRDLAEALAALTTGQGIDAPSVREAIGEVLADMGAVIEGMPVASDLAALTEITDAAIRAAVSPPSRTAKRTGYETVGHAVGEHSQTIRATAALTTPQEVQIAAKVVPVSYEASASCSQGVCPSGCSHLMWQCAACSCEGGWGLSRGLLEELAAKHECPPAWGEGDATDPAFEALEQELWKHQPVLSMEDGSIRGCQCLDRVFLRGREDWGTHLAEVFRALSRDIAGEIEADKHPVADERVEFFNAGLDRAAEIVRNGR